MATVSCTCDGFAWSGRRFLVRAFARRRPRHSSLVYGRALDRNTHQSPLGNRCWSGWSGPGTGQKLFWRCPGLRFPSLCLGALLPGQCVSLRGFAIQAGGRQTCAQVDFVFSWKLFLGRCGGSGIGQCAPVDGGAPGFGVLDLQSRAAALGIAHLCLLARIGIRAPLETVVGAVGVDRGPARSYFGGASGFGFLHFA